MHDTRSTLCANIDIVNMNKSSPHSFCLYYQNVRGLNTKTHEILNSSCSCQYDVPTFTEIWLDSRTSNSEIISEDFNVA